MPGDGGDESMRAALSGDTSRVAPQPRRPGAASRTTREDFQMAVGFVFLVLHKESNFF